MTETRRFLVNITLYSLLSYYMWELPDFKFRVMMLIVIIIHVNNYLNSAVVDAIKKVGESK